MKKGIIHFLVNCLLILGGTWLLELFLPWWSIAILPFVINAVRKTNSGIAFFSGFFGIFLLWFAMASFINFKTHGILTGKMSALIGLPPSNLLLIFISALLGALIGGLAALSGKYIRDLFEKN